MNTIQESFKGYADKVIPKEAGITQIKETQQAFYAGSLSTIQLFLKIIEFDEDTACKMLDTLNEEVDTFFVDATRVK